jgi:hypothetical protein
VSTGEGSMEGPRGAGVGTPMFFHSWVCRRERGTHALVPLSSILWRNSAEVQKLRLGDLTSFRTVRAKTNHHHSLILTSPWNPDVKSFLQAPCRRPRSSGPQLTSFEDACSATWIGEAAGRGQLGGRPGLEAQGRLSWHRARVGGGCEGLQGAKTDASPGSWLAEKPAR